MILELNNFCDVSYEKYELPNIGLCLLNGNSGSGKTTIINAFISALYKEHCGKNYSGNKTSVKLILDDFEICRSSKSKCEYRDVNGLVLKDDVAFSHIINKYGEYNVFMSSSFSTHKSWFFTGLTTKEKLKVIEQICEIDNIKKENYIKKIDSELKTLKNNKIINDNELYKLNSNIIQIQGDLGEYNRVELIPTEKFLDNYGQEIKNMMGLDRSKWTQNLYKFKLHHINENNNLLKIENDNKKKNIENNKNNEIENKNIERFENEKKNIIIDESIINNYNNKNNNLLKQINYIHKKKEYNDLINKRNNLLNDINNNTSTEPKYNFADLCCLKNYIGININEEIEKLEQAKTYISDKMMYLYRCELERLHNTLLEEYNNCEKESNQESIILLKNQINLNILTCPSCDSKLCLDGNKLSLSDYIDKDKLNEQLNRLIIKENSYNLGRDILNNFKKLEDGIYKTKIIVLNQKNEYVDKGDDYINRTLDNYRRVKQLPGVDVLKEIENYDKYQDKLKNIRELENINKKLEDYKELENIESNNLDELTEKLNNLKNDYELQIYYKKQINEINNKINESMRKIKEVPEYSDEKIIEYELNIRKIEEFCETFNNNIITQNELYKLNETMILRDNLMDEKKKQDDKISGLTKLKRVIDDSYASIIQRNIENINILSNEFVTEMFIEPITLELSTLRQLKDKDEEKISADINVILDGKTHDNLYGLSTGQELRVCLSLLLAFAMIHKTPFIFLDESIATLDIESKENVLKLIKNYTEKEKMLIINANHEANQAYYDTVIDLVK